MAAQSEWVGPKGAPERWWWGQGGLGASAWKYHIYQATVAGMYHGLEYCRLANGGSLCSPNGRYGKSGASVSQAADEQIKKLPVSWRPPNLGITTSPGGEADQIGQALKL